MTSFWIACAALLMAALPFIVLPLWRGARSGNAGVNNEVQRDAANLEILRDQSAELEADLRNGLLTQEAYEQGKRELQARLLDEVRTTTVEAAAETGKPRNSARVLAIVLAISLPLFSVPIYLTIGNTKALLPQPAAGMGDFGIVRSEAKLQELEKELEQKPENPEGWLVLARSYTGMQRYPDAVRAYEQLLKLVPNEAQLWADYADVYGMTKKSLLGEPARFIDKALELDSNNFLALALAGSAAMERRDYDAAIKHWTKLTDLLPPDHSELQMIRNGIKQAREFLSQQKSEKGTPKSASGPAVTITGKVSLSPALAGKAGPSDTVFVFARDAQNKKMLLAALRKQVKDLPLQFAFDDNVLMQPQTKLSSFEQIEVVARVSKTGNPIAQPGDLQGTTGAAKPGARELNILIDSIVQ